MSRTPTRWPGLSLVGLLACAGAAPAAEVQPPVPLRTPPVLVPEETAGSGLAPEASVRVSLDERGVVRKVEVVSIQPASEFDALFREVLVTTLSEWRYAPQRRDGVAEPATLEWRVRFPARAESLPDMTRNLAPADPLPGFDAPARRAAILALPEERRVSMLEAEARIAASYLEAERQVKRSSARFVVYTDAGDAELAASMAGNLEAIFNALAQDLLPGVPPQPERYKIHVFAFREPVRYQRVVDELGAYEWSAGFYSPVGLIALHVQQGSADEVLEVLLHEATHAFVDCHVVRRGAYLPRWLDEGFADYVANSAIKNGRLIPGKTQRKRYELYMGMAGLVETDSGLQLGEAKEALRAGRGLGVEKLLGASPEIFYGESRHLYYASAWLLVHFLRHGGEGWDSGRFQQLVLYLSEGYPADAAASQLYGPLDAADRVFRTYVQSF